MRRLMKEFLLPIAVAVGLAFVIQAAVAKPYEIPTESMVPTIKANDRIIANRLIYKFRDIERGDIIVFDPPPSATRTCGEAGGGNVPYVKRVIGVAGDTVEVREDGPTLVNGEPFDVPAALPNPEQRGGQTSRTFTVPAERLFVLGDNRPGSCDGHQWQPDPYVPVDSVIGQAEVLYWPLSHLAFLD